MLYYNKNHGGAVAMRYNDRDVVTSLEILRNNLTRYMEAVVRSKTENFTFVRRAAYKKLVEEIDALLLNQTIPDVKNMMFAEIENGGEYDFSLSEDGTLLIIEGKYIIAYSKNVAMGDFFLKCDIVNTRNALPADYDLIRELAHVKQVYEDFSGMSRAEFVAVHSNMAVYKELDALAKLMEENIEEIEPQYLCSPKKLRWSAEYKIPSKGIATIAKFLKENLNADVFFKDGKPYVCEHHGKPTESPLSEWTIELYYSRDDCRDYFKCVGVGINTPITQRLTFFNEKSTAREMKLFQPIAERFTDYSAALHPEKSIMSIRGNW
jgi:hypothetical protein